MRFTQPLQSSLKDLSINCKTRNDIKFANGSDLYKDKSYFNTPACVFHQSDPSGKNHCQTIVLSTSLISWPLASLFVFAIILIPLKKHFLHNRWFSWKFDRERALTRGTIELQEQSPSRGLAWWSRSGINQDQTDLENIYQGTEILLSRRKVVIF